MARPIVLSNGQLHVGINDFGLVHDFYFPYVGLENHAAGKGLRHKVGVWIDGRTSWLDDGAWEFSFSTADEALVGHVRAKHAALGVIIEFDDFVDTECSAFLRNVHVVNLHGEARAIRLFMHQAFAIGDSRSNTDTAQFLPSSSAILHYRGRRAFVIGAVDQYDNPFDQHSIGLFGIEGHEGTWRDADDGELAMGNVEHGRVDSTLRFCLQVPAHSSQRVHYWIAAATTTREAVRIHKLIREHGLSTHLQRTVEWWHEWLQPALKVVERVPREHQRLFVRSLMLLRSHIDNHGAVIASTDTGMLNYSRDAYGYCWPRDGAYGVWPLIRLGYTDEPLNFFRFCHRALHPRGYLQHKYRADGALGSSWHPYVHGAISAPPIQEDETALVVFMFAQYYHLHPNAKLLHEFYEPFIKKMAHFLTVHVDEETGLPKPSYDLWEEIFLTTTYTTATTYAALHAGAELAEAAGDEQSAVRWRMAADEMKLAARHHLYNADAKHLRKGMLFDGESISYNDTLDTASFYGAFMYGLFELDGEEITHTIAAIEDRLLHPNGVGLPRYENDNYLRANAATPGNLWFITSLWRAQYYTEKGDLSERTKVLDWVRAHASKTGMLSEQLDPGSEEHLSVEPLAWSHAEYLSSLLDIVSEASAPEEAA